MAAKDDLERIYQLFINREQPLAFFRGLAEYADFVFEDLWLRQIVDQQLAERRLLIKQIEEAERQTLSEMNGAKDALVALLKKHRLKVKTLKRFQTHSWGKTTLLQELRALEENNDTGIDTFVSNKLEKFLFDMAANLLAAGHHEDLKGYLASEEKFIDYYGRINGPSQYRHTGNAHGSFIFSKTWPRRWELERDFERERKLKSWEAFEKLTHFRMAYKLAQKTVDMRLLPEGGTEKEPWFGAARENVEVASIARDIQRLVEGDYDFYSRLASGLEAVGGKDFKIERVVEFRDVAQTVHGVITRAINQNDLSEMPSADFAGAVISYNPTSGVGRVGVRKFKLTDGTPEYRIFKRLYENINEKIGRYDVLELGYFYEDGEDPVPTKKTLETAFINKVAKTIREKTGLSTEQLVQNRGNLTLVGQKSSTNEPQARPK